jgi:hypothetical protein
MAAIEISCRERKNTFWRGILLIHSAKSSAPHISLFKPKFKKKFNSSPLSPCYPHQWPRLQRPTLRAERTRLLRRQPDVIFKEKT